MCEFTAILESGQERTVLARNIVKAKTKDGRITLMDSLGRITRVEGKVIVVVDTLMQELILRNGSISDTVVQESPMPAELEALGRFHGHLGPYVVLGMRMGQIARQQYPNRIYATVFSGKKRPRSCLADGVQFTSCCTIGKNNIEIIDDGQARAIFTDGKTQMEIAVLPKVLSDVDSGMATANEEETSLKLYREKEELMFSIVKGQ